MEIKEITLIEIGAPSGTPEWQWAKVEAALAYPGSQCRAAVIFRLHIPRRPDMTLADMQTAAHDQVIEIMKAMTLALDETSLVEWDEKGRSEITS